MTRDCDCQRDLDALRAIFIGDVVNTTGVVCISGGDLCMCYRKPMCYASGDVVDVAMPETPLLSLMTQFQAVPEENASAPCFFRSRLVLVLWRIHLQRPRRLPRCQLPSLSTSTQVVDAPENQQLVLDSSSITTRPLLQDRYSGTKSIRAHVSNDRSSPQF